MKYSQLIDGSTGAQSTEKLQKFYEGAKIPAEKKPYLTNHDLSHGPYMATENGELILDVSSQIATMGLGFNPMAFGGVAQWIESWINHPNTKEFEALRRSYDAFFARTLGWQSAHSFFCNSGAEANEVALGDAFKKRRKESQTKVLAFEGSFHGRFLVSLSATWNPVKRELFEWPDFPATFVPFPATPFDHSKAVKTPKGWLDFWANANRTSLGPAPFKGDGYLDKELEVLTQVYQQLAKEEIFAVLIEPMQCEGGDRYATARFFQALLMLCRSFEVPLIFDEVQTGFGLGGEFFWHRLYDLKDPDGNVAFPDYVLCAKKAQIGIVLSHQAIAWREQFAAHSAIRGYVHAQVIDQSSPLIDDIAKKAHAKLLKFVKQFSKHLHSPRAQGLAFSFDFHDKDLLTEFINVRFFHGLLYYPAGDCTARFRLNLRFHDEELDLLFSRLESALNQALGKEVKPHAKLEIPTTVGRYHRLQKKLVRWKLASLKSKPKLAESDVLKELQPMLRDQEIKLISLSKKTLPNYINKIMALQRMLYEPTRITPKQSYIDAMNTKQGVGIVAERKGKLVGMGFAGSLSLFPDERGVMRDPQLNDPDVIYSLELGIHPKFQTEGIGRIIKAAIVCIAHAKGDTAIRGRNRDKLAGGMVKINLSLGAYELFHLEEDYLDDHPHRDCFYYSNPVRWKYPEISLSNAIESPLGVAGLDGNFVETNYAALLNKVCLSNFVSEPFLKAVEHFLDYVPVSLRHAYTTSGQSECLDKAVKTIWWHRKHQRLLGFERCEFGYGSFLSRGLSGESPYFPTGRLPYPTEENQKALLKQLEKTLKEQNYLGVFIEPCRQSDFKKAPLEFLKAMVALCRKLGVPVVFNDTGSLFCRGFEGFMASQAVEPDVGMAFLGGQMGMVYCRKEWFVESPLALISTWDGDEYSMFAFDRALTQFETGRQENLKIRDEFTKTLKRVLKAYPVEVEVENGFGLLRGVLPFNLRGYFESIAPAIYRVCPKESEMKRFNTLWKKQV